MVTRSPSAPNVGSDVRGPCAAHVDRAQVAGADAVGLAMPGQDVAQLLDQFEGWKAVDVADAIRGPPPKRRQ